VRKGTKLDVDRGFFQVFAHDGADGARPERFLELGEDEPSRDRVDRVNSCVGTLREQQTRSARRQSADSAALYLVSASFLPPGRETLRTSKDQDLFLLQLFLVWGSFSPTGGAQFFPLPRGVVFPPRGV
jgi:hypothetical protein